MGTSGLNFLSVYKVVKLLLKSSVSGLSGAGGNVEAGLNFNFLSVLGRRAAVSIRSPEERRGVPLTADGRIVFAVIGFTVSLPEAFGLSSTGRFTQTPLLPAVPGAFQVTVGDIIADPSVQLSVPAADGSVVSSVKTLALSSLTAAQLLAADFPIPEREFTLIPWRPFRPHPVHWTVDVGLTDAGSTFLSMTILAAMCRGGAVTSPG